MISVPSEKDGMAFNFLFQITSLIRVRQKSVRQFFASNSKRLHIFKEYVYHSVCCIYHIFVCI